MYLRNTWYVAAWSDEIGDRPVGRVILGEPVVLYRDADRAVIALEDACPHRKLPLSMGEVVGNHLRCGYHGLEFGADGACVRAPGLSRMPPNACVKPYPIAERYGLVWIWMGPSELADPDTIIPVAHYDDPAWGVNRGPAMNVDCGYLYMTDNLLDPSHVTYVHKTSLGNVATADVPVKMSVVENGVLASRWMLDCELAPFFTPYVNFTGRADRLQHYEVQYPSHAIIRDIIAPANSGAPQGNLHPNVFLMDSYNFVTPVSENTCRYFWFQVRNFRPDCLETSRALTNDFIAAFKEDLVVLAAVDRGMKNKRTPNTDIETDAAPLRFRRVLKKMIDAEQALQAVLS